MNAYFLMTRDEIGIDELPWDLSHGFPQYYERICDLVFAETRGRARAIFAGNNREFDFLEPMSIQLVAKGVNRLAGIAEYNDIIHIYICPSSWADGPSDVVLDLIVNDYQDYPAKEY
jgi:hypothetical protein